MTVRSRSLAIAAAAALAVVLTACASDSDPSGEPSDPDDITVSHVHGLGIDPADDQLYVATHEGIITRSEDGRALLVGDSKADYMGFTVSGSKTFLASGHPAPGSDEPANRGLIKSTDAGRTWKTLSLAGEVDFHALDYAHEMIFGYDSTNGMLRVSKDGKTWRDRARLQAVDIAVSPDNEKVVLATTQQGIAQSTDGGDTFAPGAAPVLAFVSWPEPDALFGIDPSGKLSRSTDGGATWQVAGTVPGGQPQALTAVSADRILAATQDGVYESRDGGKNFTERLTVSSTGHR